jgi:bifunctional non-homologous end joining protein LigD
VSPLPPGACFNSGRAWAATVDDIEHADMLVFDLDPGEGVAWDFVVATAVRMRELFEKEGLAQWPKLTGGKGLHLVAPLSGKAHARCRARLCAPAGAAAREHRSGELHHLGRAGATAGQAVHRLPAQRRGTTAVGAYSPRVREGFPIAAPVTWREVGRGIKPDAFTMCRPPRPR